MVSVDLFIGHWSMKSVFEEKWKIEICGSKVRVRPQIAEANRGERSYNGTAVAIT